VVAELQRVARAAGFGHGRHAGRVVACVVVVGVCSRKEREGCERGRRRKVVVVSMTLSLGARTYSAPARPA
jgi:hypothetical protein